MPIQAAVRGVPNAQVTFRCLGASLLFGGVGIWLSGQIGALTEPFGIRAVYVGIAAGTALAAAATLSFRDRLMGLLAE